MKLTTTNIPSTHLTREYCLKNSLLISMIDGAIIDLKKTFPTTKKTRLKLPQINSLSSDSMAFLGKRVHEHAFKGVSSKTTTSNVKKLKVQDTFVWNFSSPMSDSKMHKPMASFDHVLSSEDKEMGFGKWDNINDSDEIISKDKTEFFEQMDCC